MSAVVDVLVAPRAAFGSIRDVPRGWLAVIVVCVLALLGALGELPASRHVLEATFGSSDAAALTPAQRAQAVDLATKGQWALVVLAPLATLAAIGWGTLAFAAAAAASGAAQLRRAFALAATIAVVRLGVGALAVAAIALARGAASFTTQYALTVAMPSLAWLVPPGAPKLAAALATINPFQIWTFGLALTGATLVLGVRRPLAIGAAVALVAPELVIAAVAAR